MGGHFEVLFQYTFDHNKHLSFCNLLQLQCRIPHRQRDHSIILHPVLYQVELDHHMSVILCGGRITFAGGGKTIAAIMKSIATPDNEVGDVAGGNQNELCNHFIHDVVEVKICAVWSLARDHYETEREEYTDCVYCNGVPTLGIVKSTKYRYTLMHRLIQPSSPHGKK